MLTVTEGAVNATLTYFTGKPDEVGYSNDNSPIDITGNAAGAGTGFTWDFATGDSVIPALMLFPVTTSATGMRARVGVGPTRQRA